MANLLFGGTKSSMEKSIAEINHQNILKELSCLNDHPSAYEGDKRLGKLVHLWNSLKKDSCATKFVEKTFYTLLRKSSLFILSSHWENKTISARLKQELLDSIQFCGGLLSDCVKNCMRRCTDIKHLSINPWNNPFLEWHQLFDGSVSLDDKDVQAYLRNEPQDIVLCRIHFLVTAGCVLQAMCMVKYMIRFYSGACKKHDHIQHSNQMAKHIIFGSRDNRSEYASIQWFLFLLERKKTLPELAKELSDLNAHEALHIIEHLQKMPDKKPFTDVIIQIFLTQEILDSKTSCCLKELLTYWCLSMKDRKLSPSEIMENCRKLFGRFAPTSAHFYILIDVLYDQFGNYLLSLYMELFVRATTTDINHLEVSRSLNKKTEIIDLETHLGDMFAKHAMLFVGHQESVARECFLSAFSLRPTDQRLCILQSVTSNILSSRYSSEDLSTLSNHPSNLSAFGTNSVSNSRYAKTVHPLLSKGIQHIPYSIVLDMVIVLESVRPSVFQFNEFSWDHSITELSDYLRERKQELLMAESSDKNKSDSQTSSPTKLSENWMHLDRIPSSAKSALDNCLDVDMRLRKLEEKEVIWPSTDFVNPHFLAHVAANIEVITDGKNVPSSSTDVFKKMEETKSDELPPVLKKEEPLSNYREKCNTAEYHKLDRNILNLSMTAATNTSKSIFEKRSHSFDVKTNILHQKGISDEKKQSSISSAHSTIVKTIGTESSKLFVNSSVISSVLVSNNSKKRPVTSTGSVEDKRSKSPVSLNLTSLQKGENTEDNKLLNALEGLGSVQHIIGSNTSSLVESQKIGKHVIMAPKSKISESTIVRRQLVIDPIKSSSQNFTSPKIPGEKNNFGLSKENSNISPNYSIHTEKLTAQNEISSNLRINEASEAHKHPFLHNALQNFPNAISVDVSTKRIISVPVNCSKNPLVSVRVPATVEKNVESLTNNPLDRNSVIQHTKQLQNSFGNEKASSGQCGVSIPINQVSKMLPFQTIKLSSLPEMKDLSSASMVSAKLVLPAPHDGTLNQSQAQIGSSSISKNTVTIPGYVVVKKNQCLQSKHGIVKVINPPRAGWKTLKSIHGKMDYAKIDFSPGLKKTGVCQKVSVYQPNSAESTHTSSPGMDEVNALADSNEMMKPIALQRFQTVTPTIHANSGDSYLYSDYKIGATISRLQTDDNIAMNNKSTRCETTLPPCEGISNSISGSSKIIRGKDEQDNLSKLISLKGNKEKQTFTVDSKVGHSQLTKNDSIKNQNTHEASINSLLNMPSLSVTPLSNNTNILKKTIVADTVAPNSPDQLMKLGSISGIKNIEISEVQKKIEKTHPVFQPNVPKLHSEVKDTYVNKLTYESLQSTSRGNTSAFNSETKTILEAKTCCSPHELKPCESCIVRNTQIHGSSRSPQSKIFTSHEVTSPNSKVTEELCTTLHPEKKKLTKVKRFSCRFCGKMLSSRHTLKMHELKLHKFKWDEKDKEHTKVSTSQTHGNSVTEVSLPSEARNNDVADYQDRSQKVVVNNSCEGMNSESNKNNDTIESKIIKYFSDFMSPEDEHPSSNQNSMFHSETGNSVLDSSSDMPLQESEIDNVNKTSTCETAVLNNDIPLVSLSVPIEQGYANEPKDKHFQSTELRSSWQVAGSAMQCLNNPFMDDGDFFDEFPAQSSDFFGRPAPSLITGNECYNAEREPFSQNPDDEKKGNNYELFQDSYKKNDLQSRPSFAAMTCGSLDLNDAKEPQGWNNSCTSSSYTEPIKNESYSQDLKKDIKNEFSSSSYPNIDFEVESCLQTVSDGGGNENQIFDGDFKLPLGNFSSPSTSHVHGSEADSFSLSCHSSPPFSPSYASGNEQNSNLVTSYLKESVAKNEKKDDRKRDQTICSVCQKVLAYNSLRRHMKMVHDIDFKVSRKNVLTFSPSSFNESSSVSSDSEMQPFKLPDSPIARPQSVISSSPISTLVPNLNIQERHNYDDTSYTSIEDDKSETLSFSNVKESVDNVNFKHSDKVSGYNSYGKHIKISTEASPQSSKNDAKNSNSISQSKSVLPQIICGSTLYQALVGKAHSQITTGSTSSKTVQKIIPQTEANKKLLETTVTNAFCKSVSVANNVSLGTTPSQHIKCLPDKLFPCTLCQKSFSSEASRRRHVKNVHKNSCEENEKKKRDAEEECNRKVQSIIQKITEETKLKEEERRKTSGLLKKSSLCTTSHSSQSTNSSKVSKAMGGLDTQTGLSEVGKETGNFKAISVTQLPRSNASCVSKDTVVLCPVVSISHPSSSRIPVISEMCPTYEKTPNQLCHSDLFTQQTQNLLHSSDSSKSECQGNNLKNDEFFSPIENTIGDLQSLLNTNNQMFNSSLDASLGPKPDVQNILQPEFIGLDTLVMQYLNDTGISNPDTLGQDITLKTEHINVPQVKLEPPLNEDHAVHNASSAKGVLPKFSPALTITSSEQVCETKLMQSYRDTSGIGESIIASLPDLNASLNSNVNVENIHKSFDSRLFAEYDSHRLATIVPISKQSFINQQQNNVSSQETSFGNANVCSVLCKSVHLKSSVCKLGQNNKLSSMSPKPEDIVSTAGNARQPSTPGNTELKNAVSKQCSDFSFSFADTSNKSQVNAFNSKILCENLNSLSDAASHFEVGNERIPFNGSSTSENEVNLMNVQSIHANIDRTFHNKMTAVTNKSNEIAAHNSGAKPMISSASLYVTSTFDQPKFISASAICNRNTHESVTVSATDYMKSKLFESKNISSHSMIPLCDKKSFIAQQQNSNNRNEPVSDTNFTKMSIQSPAYHANVVDTTKLSTTSNHDGTCGSGIVISPASAPVTGESSSGISNFKLPQCYGKKSSSMHKSPLSLVATNSNIFDSSASCTLTAPTTFPKNHSNKDKIPLSTFYGGSSITAPTSRESNMKTNLLNFNETAVTCLSSTDDASTLMLSESSNSKSVNCLKSASFIKTSVSIQAGGRKSTELHKAELKTTPIDSANIDVSLCKSNPPQSSEQSSNSPRKFIAKQKKSIAKPTVPEKKSQSSQTNNDNGTIAESPNTAVICNDTRHSPLPSPMVQRKVIKGKEVKLVCLDRKVMEAQNTAVVLSRLESKQAVGVSLLDANGRKANLQHRDLVNVSKILSSIKRTIIPNKEDMYKSSKTCPTKNIVLSSDKAGKDEAKNSEPNPSQKVLKVPKVNAEISAGVEGSDAKNSISKKENIDYSHASAEKPSKISQNENCTKLVIRKVKINQKNKVQYYVPSSKTMSEDEVSSFSEEICRNKRDTVCQMTKEDVIDRKDKGGFGPEKKNKKKPKSTINRQLSVTKAKKNLEVAKVPAKAFQSKKKNSALDGIENKLMGHCEQKHLLASSSNKESSVENDHELCDASVKKKKRAVEISKTPARKHVNNRSSNTSGNSKNISSSKSSSRVSENIEWSSESDFTIPDPPGRRKQRTTRNSTYGDRQASNRQEEKTLSATVSEDCEQLTKILEKKHKSGKVTASYQENNLSSRCSADKKRDGQRINTNKNESYSLETIKKEPLEDEFDVPEIPQKHPVKLTRKRKRNLVGDVKNESLEATKLSSFVNIKMEEKEPVSKIKEKLHFSGTSPSEQKIVCGSKVFVTRDCTVKLKKVDISTVNGISVSPYSKVLERKNPSKRTCQKSSRISEKRTVEMSFDENAQDRVNPKKSVLSERKANCETLIVRKAAKAGPPNDDEEKQSNSPDETSVEGKHLRPRRKMLSHNLWSKRSFGKRGSAPICITIDSD